MVKRIFVIVVNWKMFKIKDEVLEFIFVVNVVVLSRDEVEFIICVLVILLNLLVKCEGEYICIGV